MVGRRRGDYFGSAADYRYSRAVDCKGALCDHHRHDRRQHDRSTGAGVRQFADQVGDRQRRLCNRISADNDFTNSRGATNDDLLGEFVESDHEFVMRANTPCPINDYKQRRLRIFQAACTMFGD